MKRDIYLIITDYLKGSITDENLNFLLNWINESDNNKALFKQIENVWELTGQMKTKVQIDIQKEWTNFLNIRSLSGKD